MDLSGEKPLGRRKSPAAAFCPGKGALAGERARLRHFVRGKGLWPEKEHGCGILSRERVDWPEKEPKGRAGDEGEELTDRPRGARCGELSGTDGRIFPE